MNDPPSRSATTTCRPMSTSRLPAERRPRSKPISPPHPALREQVAADRRTRALLRGQLEAKATEPIPARLRIAQHPRQPARGAG